MRIAKRVDLILLCIEVACYSEALNAATTVVSALCHSTTFCVRKNRLNVFCIASLVVIANA